MTCWTPRTVRELATSGETPERQNTLAVCSAGRSSRTRRFFCFSYEAALRSRDTDKRGPNAASRLQAPPLAAIFERVLLSPTARKPDGLAQSTLAFISFLAGRYSIRVIKSSLEALLVVAV